MKGLFSGDGVYGDFILLGMNGVGVARNGPILWENDATGSRKVFKYLPALRDAINKSKIAEKTENPEFWIFNI